MPPKAASSIHHRTRSHRTRPPDAVLEDVRDLDPAGIVAELRRLAVEARHPALSAGLVWLADTVDDVDATYPPGTRERSVFDRAAGIGARWVGRR